MCNPVHKLVALITCEWATRLPCQSTTAIMATQFGGDDVPCAICCSPLPVGAHSRLSKPPSQSNESSSFFFGSLHEPIMVEDECMHVSCALRSWKKAARQFMLSNRLQATSVLAACSCEVTTVFLDVWKAFTSSTIAFKKSLQKLTPQRSVPLSNQKVKLEKTTLHLCASQLVSTVCAA